MSDVLTEEEHKERADAFFNSDPNDKDAPAQDLLDVMKKFVHNYAKQLGDIRECLSETISEAWDSENDMVMLNMQPFDRDHIVNMVKTENIQMNKVVLAFATLVAEVKHLTLHAEQKFYGPLTMFGVTSSELHAEQGGEGVDAKVRDEQLGSSFDNDAASGISEADRKKLLSPEVRMGAFLPILQDVSNFAQRCHVVIRTIVNQLACLLHDRQKLYITTFKMVQLDSVFEALGELSRVLLTLDSIIQNNEEISNSWNMYKRMIKYVRADPAKYSVDEQRLRTLESLMLNLDKYVISANMFTSMLDQDYGLPNGGQGAKALVAGNRVLSHEFNESLQRFLTKMKAGLQEAMETYEREKLVDLFCLYALYRRLFRATGTKISQC
jgi:WASH complex subunit 7